MTTRNGSALRWLPTFLAFPIGGLLANLIAGPVDGLVAALLAGAITGLALGAIQAWAMGTNGPPADRWIAATALGLALGLPGSSGSSTCRDTARPRRVAGSTATSAS